MNYFKHVFQEFWPQMKKQILHRTYVNTEQLLHKIRIGCLRNLYWRDLQENIHTEIQHQIIGCNLTNIPEDFRPKIVHENCAFDALVVTCMSFACPLHFCFLLG